MMKTLPLIARVTVLSLTIGLAAGVVGAVVTENYLASYTASLEQTGERQFQLSTQKPRPIPGTFEEALANARKTLGPAVAQFYTGSSDPAILPGTAIGEGVVVTSDGWIATMKQVFDDQNHGGKLVSRVVVDGSVYAIGTTVYDPQTDLVMVKLVDANGLPVVPFGASDQVVSGDLAFVALPNGGLLPSSVSEARHWTASAAANPAEQFTTDFALANNGMLAGSPVVNSSGELIAFTVPKTEGNASGLGAIPLHHLLSVIKSIIRSNEPMRVSFGATVTDLHAVVGSALARGFDHGDVVNAVTVGSPAAVAGLQKGDIITQVGDANLTASPTFAELLTTYSPGDSVILNVDRAGVATSITVQLGRK